MRYLFFLLIFLSVQGPELSAQLTEYNFQSYRQAPTRFRGARIDPQFDGSHRRNRQGPAFTPDRRHDIGLLLSGVYFDIINDWEYKDETTIFGAVFPTIFIQSDEDEDSRSRDWAGSLFLNVDKFRENYIDYNRWFWGYALDVDLNASYRDLKREVGNQTTELTTTRFNFVPRAALRLGWGRLENISNAWHSYRILNRLNYTQIMDRDFTHLELNRLGQFLDELKTERIFDDRLRYIAQVQFLDYFLRDEFGLESETIKYFVELNDMWAFGISEDRLMGQKTFFDFGGLWTYGRDKPGDLLTEGGYAGTFLSFNYIRAIPIKRDHQFNVTASLYGDYLFGGIRQVVGPDFNEELWSFQPSLELFYAFYPTTRTEWEWSMEYRSVWGGRRNESRQNFDQTFERQDVWSSDFVFNYFIRTTTTLSGRVSMNYLSDSDRPFLFPDQGRYLFGTNIWNIQYDIAFTHIFF